MIQNINLVKPIQKIWINFLFPENEFNHILNIKKLSSTKIINLILNSSFKINFTNLL